MDGVGYSPVFEHELVYLVTEDDPGMFPSGFERITVTG